MRALSCLLALSASLMAGCGAEVATTAATASKAQAVQLEQARAQAQQLQEQLNASIQKANAAASAAGQ